LSSIPTTENLKREITPVSLALANINVMVGSGIFALPALVAEDLGATAILAYFTCAALVFLIALCFAELGSQTTISGGPYTYIEKAFGPYAGFLAGNIYLFGAMASDAALANALADTLQIFFPALRIELNRGIFHLIIFTSLAWLNISSVKNGIRFAMLSSFAKLIPLIILVCLAAPHVETHNLKWEVSPTLSNIGSASLLLFFAFMGFETSLINGGEIKNPSRTVPLGLFGGISIVLLLYLAIQTITQGTFGDLMTKEKAAPLTSVANLVMGKTGMWLILIVTAVSIVGSLSGEVLSMPRVMFASARDGLMPKALAKVHPKFSTPHIAIFVYAVIGFILSVSGGFKQLAIIASAAILLLYLGSVLASIKLRQKPIELHKKTFRMPGGITAPILATVGILWLLAQSSKQEIISVFISISLFSCIYFFIWLQKQKNKCR